MSTESPSEASRRVQALWEIAGRACLVAREISCLGRGGYPSGASARGRTLLELAVTADILATCEPVVIRRYDLQLLRTSKMAATSYAEFAVELFGDSAAEDARDARESALKLADVIGEHQENDSGAGIMNGNFWWARDEIRRRGRDLSANHNVSFDDLARATPLRPCLPFYRHFNRPIHAGPDGQADLYVAGPNGRVFLIGPTDSGYVDPAQVALHSLLHVLECLGGVAADELSPSVDLAPQLTVLRQSADEVVDALSDQDPRLNGEWLDSDNEAWLASDAGSNKRTG
jgi:hypothetical protein